MDIGAHLREARERRGITLRQVADTTKLSMAVLGQIERNEFDRLPGGLFRKGYLRAFAAEVGVDPAEVVGAYTDQHGTGPSGGAAYAPLVLMSAQEDARTRRHALALVIALGLVFVAYIFMRDGRQAATPADAVLVPARPAPVSAAPLVAGVMSSTVLAAERDEWGLFLVIEPAGACWVSVFADGERSIYRVIQAGERVNVMAREELVLRVGQPAMFDYILNGEPGRPLGGGWEPVTVTITRDNYETFVDSTDGPIKVPVSVS